MFGSSSEPDPFVPEAGLDAARNHGIQHLACGFIAHPVLEVAARTHGLQGGQIAALVMYACDSITRKLFGHVCQPVTVALQPFIFGEGFSFADAVERAPCPVSHAAGQVTISVAIEGSAGRIGRAPVDVGQLKSFAVAIRRVAAAMLNNHRMVLRYLIEIVNVQLAVVLHLGVSEEIPFHPGARGCLPSFCAELVNNAGDGHELHVIRVTDHHVVE
jgi:hypothetical protein